MGDIFGGGGGGGGGDGDEQNTTEKALPSPAQIAATRSGFNTASGIAGLAKNLPYFAQIAASPSYQKALQNTANTWGDWMGTAPLDLSEGMAPTTQGAFGSVIDAGKIMNEQIGKLDPAQQYLISQWAGPGMITPGSPYSPAIYDPYVQQKPLLHQGTAAQGGVGTIGTGGIPTTTLPTNLQPPVTPSVTPSPTPGTGGSGGQGGSGGGFGGGGFGGGSLIIGGKKYKKNSKGKYVLVGTANKTGGTGGGQGGMGQQGGEQGGLSGHWGGWGNAFGNTPGPTNINPGKGWF